MTNNKIISKEKYDDLLQAEDELFKYVIERLLDFYEVPDSSDWDSEVDPNVSNNLINEIKNIIHKFIEENDYDYTEWEKSEEE